MCFGVYQNRVFRVRKYFGNPSFYETTEKLWLCETETERERGRERERKTDAKNSVTVAN
jgi:hypothetical protein